MFFCLIFHWNCSSKFANFVDYYQKNFLFFQLVLFGSFHIMNLNNSTKFSSEYDISIAPTKIHNIRRYVYSKELNAQKNWKFELVVENQLDVPFSVTFWLQEIK